MFMQSFRRNLCSPIHSPTTEYAEAFFTHPLGPLLLKKKGKQIAEWPTAIVDTKARWPACAPSV
jgi:hypothetical protein